MKFTCFGILITSDLKANLHERTGTPEKPSSSPYVLTNRVKQQSFVTILSSFVGNLLSVFTLWSSCHSLK